MRFTHETLGKTRAVLYGIILALLLVAYSVHRLLSVRTH